MKKNPPLQKTQVKTLRKVQKEELSHVDLTHSMAHYLLAIHKLKEKRGYARVTDISKELDISKGSVSIALSSLKKRSLIVEEEDSKFLLLTERGHEEVHHVLSNRTILFHFFKDLLGVSPDTAHKDACTMEHLLTAEARQKFFDFMKGVSCHCDDNKKKVILEKIKNFNSELHLCDFQKHEDFVHNQPADININLKP